MELLSTGERAVLIRAEATIERGLTSFIAVGEALSEVRDSRLYREEYGTFEGTAASGGGSPTVGLAR